MKKILMAAIRFYQKYISPYKPCCCRFYPTCSSYALQALEQYGAIRGGLLSVKRILKCNPFFPGGIDPVPPPKEKRKGSAKKKMIAYRSHRNCHNNAKYKGKNGSGADAA